MNRLDSRPIGIFDSGLGGLTVLKKIKEMLPGENIVYLGDTARVPYGTRSSAVIKKFSLQCAYFLAGKGVKCIVVACNTASSNAISELKKEIDIPMFDVVGSSIDAVRSNEKIKSIGIIGTSATIKSSVHSKKLKNIGIDVLFEKSCPLFVPLIENGEIEGKLIKLVSNKYLKNLPKVDAVILACTHYPIIKNIISCSLGNKTLLVDPADNLSIQIRKYLDKHNLLAKRNTPGSTYYLTDRDSGFEVISEMFLGENIKDKIKIANLD